MLPEYHIWESWSKTLYRWGLKDLVASFIEVAGPFTVLGAQMVYFLQPFFQSDGSRPKWQALANMLENSEQSRAFAQYLREDNQREPQ